MESKKPWLSKTLWVNAIVAIVALVSTDVANWISSHPEMAVLVFTVVNVILRAVTGGKIEMFDGLPQSQRRIQKQELPYDAKKPWLSKTIWVNVIVAAVAIFSHDVSAWIGANTELAMTVLAGVNALLRWITKDKISLTV